jgi:hypothetical protein
VLLLGKGGFTCYIGSAKGALPYFEKQGFVLPSRMNPADFFMDVIAGDISRQDDPEFKPTDLFDLWVKDEPNRISAKEEEDSKLRPDAKVFSADNATYAGLRPKRIGFCEQVTHYSHCSSLVSC